LLRNATEEAKKLIDEAKERAREVAGDAYFALQNSRELTDTARAMKNVIEGYGDQYLIPAYGLLDDLAEGFSHTQAGAKLSFVRDNMRLMIKNNLAAQCDYTDQRRREMAIKFVLDAFNGKVETIFSKIKKDNYGILLQQLKDAYQLVNNNGSAFNNATITREYFNTRSQELKWAVAVNELKLLEQEEQRRIREQIREEEKARREIEKALKEAQKEEETLKKLIEKAQKEVLNATEEQKQIYEQKLLDFESKLEFAENKNQRALSMAQQTKAGNVYIISNIGSFGENVYKIGMTRRLEPLDRVRELGDASVPFSFDVHAMIFSDDAPALEKQLHRHFMLSQLNKINPRKEFFKVSLEQIRNEIEKLNFTVKWTMTAEAKHYRESLVIEKDMEYNPEAKADWQKYQAEVSAVITFDEEDLIQSSLN
jgi:phage-related minor tail protein